MEAVFDDGSRLAIVTDPIGGGLGRTRRGRCCPVRPTRSPRRRCNCRSPTPRPAASVTSHFHFFEANPRLDFDRERAYGMRLAVPAGSSVRFGPGENLEVGLVPIGGERVVIGFAGLVDGPLDAPGARAEALRRAAACGYLGASVPEERRSAGPADTRPHPGT
ncbi:Urease subunit gamma/beta OS=Streptomyces fumanus OX=67302 GN=ureAB PE=3 SV=1 [Streptomyces fumanus]